MHTATGMLKLITSLSLMLVNLPAMADNLRVAVASNFVQAATGIARAFELNSGHTITLISGATGKHYAQITHGAPFDIFLAADRLRPERLENEGHAQPGSRFTYAIGKLALWSPKPGYVDAEAQVLQQNTFRHLAIANPKLAPYGRAAQQVLQTRNLWNRLQPKLVRGESIGQTFQFVKSGNAELGFIAYAQVKQPGKPIEGSCWLVPQSLYEPVEQQAILLTQSAGAAAFMSYLRSEQALAIMRDYGYDTP